jgi:hypothetical protein
MSSLKSPEEAAYDHDGPASGIGRLTDASRKATFSVEVIARHGGEGRTNKSTVTLPGRWRQ